MKKKLGDLLPHAILTRSADSLDFQVRFSFFEVADVIFGHPIIVYSDYEYSVTSLVNMPMVNMTVVKKYDCEKNLCFLFGGPLSRCKQTWRFWTWIVQSIFLCTAYVHKGNKFWKCAEPEIIKETF